MKYILKIMLTRTRRRDVCLRGKILVSLLVCVLHAFLGGEEESVKYSYFLVKYYFCCLMKGLNCQCPSFVFEPIKVEHGKFWSWPNSNQSLHFRVLSSICKVLCTA